MSCQLWLSAHAAVELTTGAALHRLSPKTQPSRGKSRSPGLLGVTQGLTPDGERCCWGEALSKVPSQSSVRQERRLFQRARSRVYDGVETPCQGRYALGCCGTGTQGAILSCC